MTGGLIQIVAYGTADIFLTGMPQITFFKLVYRRYTNFAIENIEQPFSGISNFGETISCTLDKVGDLVNTIYLKVVLPSVNLIDPNFVTQYNQQDEYEIINLQNQYTDFKAIINYIYAYYRELSNYISTINQNINLKNLYNYIIKITNVYYTSSEYFALKSQYNTTYNKNLILNNFIPGNNFYDSNGNYIYEGSEFLNIKISDIDIINNVANYQLSSFTSSAQLITTLNTELLNYKNNTKQIDKYMSNSILNYQKQHSHYQNYKFAWIEKIGHQIIDNIFIEIGGQIIDKHTSDWYNIWMDLDMKPELVRLYNKMIGNISSLTTYDYSIKDSYTLYVPLNFWFNKYISGSLPLIFLRYNEVRIQLTLRNLNSLYFSNAPSTFDFNSNIQLVDVSLLIDYVYLDVDERTKFAQSSQEILIETLQNYDYVGENTTSITIESFFINSVKELFWIAQPSKNIQSNFLSRYDLGIIYKINGINSIQTGTLQQEIQIVIGSHILSIGDIITIAHSLYYNGKYKIVAVDLSSITINSLFYFSENDSYLSLVSFASSSSSTTDTNPFLITSYTFEQYNRLENYDNVYSNYVQSWQTHSKACSDGINLYSFALKPEDYQPSGSANLSAYKFKSFQFTMNQKLIDYIIQNNDTLTIKTFALGYNLLTLKNGMASLVFNI
jgi:hypothetical protein